MLRTVETFMRRSRAIWWLLKPAFLRRNTSSRTSIFACTLDLAMLAASRRGMCVGDAAENKIVVCKHIPSRMQCHHRRSEKVSEGSVCLALHSGCQHHIEITSQLLKGEGGAKSFRTDWGEKFPDILCSEMDKGEEKERNMSKMKLWYMFASS